MTEHYIVLEAKSAPRRGKGEGERKERGRGRERRYREREREGGREGRREREECTHA